MHVKMGCLPPLRLRAVRSGTVYTRGKQREFETERFEPITLPCAMMFKVSLDCVLRKLVSRALLTT